MVDYWMWCGYGVKMGAACHGISMYTLWTDVVRILGGHEMEVAWTWYGHGMHMVWL